MDDLSIDIYDTEVEIEIDLDNIEPSVEQFITNIRKIICNIPPHDRFRINHSTFITNLSVDIPLHVTFGEFVNEKSIGVRKRISHLPKYTAIKEGDSMIGEDCVICSEPFKIGVYKRVLENCNHTFHKKCIDKWFCTNNNMNCPICRTEYDADVQQILRETVQKIGMENIEISVHK